MFVIEGISIAALVAAGALHGVTTSAGAVAAVGSAFHGAAVANAFHVAGAAVVATFHGGTATAAAAHGGTAAARALHDVITSVAGPTHVGAALSPKDWEVFGFLLGTIATISGALSCSKSCAKDDTISFSEEFPIVDQLKKTLQDNNTDEASILIGTVKYLKNLKDKAEQLQVFESQDLKQIIKMITENETLITNKRILEYIKCIKFRSDNKDTPTSYDNLFVEMVNATTKMDAMPIEDIARTLITLCKQAVKTQEKDGSPEAVTEIHTKPCIDSDKTDSNDAASEGSRFTKEASTPEAREKDKDIQSDNASGATKREDNVGGAELPEVASGGSRFPKEASTPAAREKDKDIQSDNVAGATEPKWPKAINMVVAFHKLTNHQIQQKQSVDSSGGAELPKAAGATEPKDNGRGKKEESKPGRGSQFRRFTGVVRTKLFLTRREKANTAADDGRGAGLAENDTEATSQLGNAASTAEGKISNAFATALRTVIIRSKTM